MGKVAKGQVPHLHVRFCVSCAVQEQDQLVVPTAGMYYLGTGQEPPTRTICLKSTGSTPPICTTVHPHF